MFERTVDLRDDGIEANEERIEDIEEAMSDLEDFAEEEYDHEALRPERLQDQMNAYEQEKRQLEGRVNIFEEILGEWEGSEFQIRMLKGSELAALQDAPGAETGGEQSIKVLEASVTGAPAGSPKDDDGNPQPGEYPWPLTTWLFEKVNSLNGTGDPNFMDGGPL